MEVGRIQLHAMLETAIGIENAFAIASASPRVSALTLGGQDLTADMGVQKTKEGRELFYARSRVVVAARAAGVFAFDTVWADINHPDGLYNETKTIVQLGFTGKAAIHPSQIDVIHSAYHPDEKKLKKARLLLVLGKISRHQATPLAILTHHHRPTRKRAKVKNSQRPLAPKIP